MGADAPKRIIDLSPPSAAEWNAVREQNAAPTAQSATGATMQKAKRLAIGMTRDVPLADRAIDASSLPWLATSDGGYAARIDVRSPGAAGIRVALEMSESNPDVVLRFAGSAPDAQVFAVPANAIAWATINDGAYWSPVLEGDTATIEIVAPPGVNRSAVWLVIDRIAHLALAGASLRNPAQKDLSDIGTSGSCNIDVACVTLHGCPRRSRRCRPPRSRRR